ncbi:MAG: polysaccharide deacetylase family protein [Acidobacteria bacterium]|nr:polysaccharide deacetylase family protein [Acidobacteriota bacterium]
MKIARRNFLASLGGVGTALGAFAASSFAQQPARPAGGGGQGNPAALSEGKSGFMTPGPKGGFTERADYIKIKVPYKERKGVTFPNGARVAVTFELAAEYWEGGPGQLSPLVVFQGPRGPEWNNISRMSWFNWEVGIPRAMDVYERYGIKATAIFSSLGALYYPAIAKELADRGHEIAAHGWDQAIPAMNLTREVERVSVRRETEVLERTSGVRPVGMLNLGGMGSSDTLEFIANEGYQWHGDFRDDTLPYGIRFQDKLMVRIPHCNYTHNDPAVFGRAPTDFHFSPQKGFEYLKETIDAQLEWAEQEPSVMQIGIHPFFGCYPDRMLTFDKTFAYLRSLPESKVWLCTYKELADYWKKTYLS